MPIATSIRFHDPVDAEFVADDPLVAGHPPSTRLVLMELPEADYDPALGLLKAREAASMISRARSRGNEKNTG